MSWRLGLAACIWLVIVGGVSLFMRQENQAATAMAPPERHTTYAAGDFSLEVTTTFPLQPDPFALTADDSGQQAALNISLGGQRIFSAEELPAHLPRRIHPLPDLVLGKNEFLVTATPPLDAVDNTASYAVRLRLLRGDAPVAQDTFWASQGATITGALRVDLAQPGENHEK